ncbi:hypothetical protein RISK_003738 [Rhodopirellula islandica]|uniref:Uncharacterized protein n=1 Tax=Rhodopirellula islandica TaxID=595434 RepID=A0A0J1BC08_RHOIS|nr:hypothetical protein RISK_003738 [Rhodopirellula islandica]
MPTFLDASFVERVNRSGRGNESFPTQGTRCLVHYQMRH